MSYQLKIGTTSYQAEIQDTDTWSQTVVRDFREKLLRIRGNYSFKAWNALYDVLYTDTVANGVCSSLTGKVYFKPCNADYEQVWEGQLKAQDGEFDLIKGSVDHQVLDNSWSADFNNSKDQKVFLRSTTSKNGTTIPSCPFAGCQFFDPTNSALGSYLTDTRRCFRVYDVLNFLVNYHGNLNVSFTSDFFDLDGDGEQYWITTGKELRTYDGTVNPDVSFSEVFEELNKKFDLWIIVEGTYDSPVIRIEPRTYALDEDIVIDVENPENIIMKTDLDLLYTIINVGSDAVDYDPSTDANYPNVRLLSWNDENYNTEGDCEFENNTLDLVSDWKIDTNSIEQALSVVFDNDDFDDDIFLIEIDPIIGVTASYVDSPATTSGTGTFKVLDYTNDSVPPAYGAGSIYFNSKFIAPSSDTYLFNGEVAVSNVDAARIYRHRIRVYQDDTLSTLLATYLGSTYTGSTSHTLDINQNISMVTGNAATAEIFINVTDTYDIDSAFMEVTWSTAGPPLGRAIKFTDDRSNGSPNISYFYNENLTNDKVITRWINAIPVEITKFISKQYDALVGGVNSYIFADTTTPRVIQYTNDSTSGYYDTDDVYNTSTYIFTAPASYFYSFDGYQTINNLYFIYPYDVWIQVKVYTDDSLSDVVYTRKGTIKTLSSSPGVFYTLFMDVDDVFMAAGNVAQIEIDSSSATGPLAAGNIVDGNMRYTKAPEEVTSGSTNPLTFLYDIQKFKLSKTNYDLITANKEKRIRFKDTKTGREWKVWPKEMTYSHQLSEVVSGEFIGYAPENPLCWVLDGQFDLSFWDDFCYWVDEYGWIDCSSTVVSNPDITGNPVGTWSLLLGTTQTGEGTFTDPAGGPVYDVYLRQTIELPAGTYTLYASASVSATSGPWAGEFTLTGASGLGSLWTATDLDQTVAQSFTVTGSSTRTFTARFAADPASSPTFTVNQINIC